MSKLRVLLLSAGILASSLTILLTGPVSAFDPNSANPFGDGIVNKVNVDSNAGKVITNFDYEFSLGNAIELKDGNILLSGHMKESWDESDCNSARSKAILVKLSPKGRLVTNFANGGIFTYERLDRDEFRQTIEDFSGSIYVIGRSIDYDLADTDLTNGCDIQNSNPVILKLNANGALNSTFGLSGSVTSIPGIDNLTAIALNGEKLILSSMSHPQGILFALNRMSGVIDNTFGVDGNGKVVFSGNNIRQISQILVQDKIYLFGDKFVESEPISDCRKESAILQWAINAVTLEGKPVDSFMNRPCGTSFSNGLKEGAYGSIFYRDGYIYVIDGILKTLSGDSIDRYDTKLLKIDGQGNIDTVYSKLLDSYLITPPFSLTRTSYAVQSRAIDKDGRLLISYNYNSDSNAIVRINQDGLPDPDFGYQGKISLGAVPNLLHLSSGVLFAFVNYSSNPTSSLYVYNVNTLRAKRPPTWSNYQRLDDGFSVEISNYSSDFDYQISLQGSGEISVEGGKIRITKLNRNGERSKFSVSTSRNGYRNDVSSFTGRSTSWESLRINTEPNLSWDGKVLWCNSTNSVTRFDGLDEVPLSRPTEIFTTVLDDSYVVILRSAPGDLSISLNRENMVASKYYYCGTRVEDNGLIGYVTSLDSNAARLVGSKLKAALQDSSKKFSEESDLARKESVLKLSQARVNWRTLIESNEKLKVGVKGELETLYSQKKISSSQYFKESRALLVKHQERVKKLTEDYKNELVKIPKDLVLSLERLEREYEERNHLLTAGYWSDLASKGIVVRS